MALDRTGRWWKGADFADLSEYLRLVTSTGYPVGPITQAICGCGGTTFQINADGTEGCALRTCPSCDAAASFGDSGDFWEESEPSAVVCPCGGNVFEAGVGFSMREGGNDEVRWITVGTRCASCGVLGSPANWKIEYSPSNHLLAMV